MKSSALIEWTTRLMASYEENIKHEIRVIELIESGHMKSHKNDQDTTQETLAYAQHALATYREGIRLMQKTTVELRKRGGDHLDHL